MAWVIIGLRLQLFFLPDSLAKVRCISAMMAVCDCSTATDQAKYSQIQDRNADLGHFGLRAAPCHAEAL